MRRLDVIVEFGFESCDFGASAEPSSTQCFQHLVDLWLENLRATKHEVRITNGPVNGPGLRHDSVTCCGNGVRPPGFRTHISSSSIQLKSASLSMWRSTVAASKYSSAIRLAACACLS